MKIKLILLAAIGALFACNKDNDLLDIYSDPDYPTIYCIKAVEERNELYENFDTTSCKFNYVPLDSLLNVYEIISGKKKGGLIRLIFPEYYNIPVLAQIVECVAGVTTAEPNQYCRIGLCTEDITIEITDEYYKFIFSQIGSACRHFWEVHVVDDQAVFIAEW